MRGEVMSDTDFLIEIGAVCSSFDSVLQGTDRTIIQQIKRIADRARVEITKRDTEIESLQAHITELEKEIYECENNEDFLGHSLPYETPTEQE